MFSSSSRRVLVGIVALSSWVCGCAASPTPVSPTQPVPTSSDPTTTSLPTATTGDPDHAEPASASQVTAAPTGSPDGVTASDPGPEPTTVSPSTTLPHATTVLPPTTVLPATTVPPTVLPPTTVLPATTVSSTQPAGTAAAGAPLVIAKGHVDLIEVTRDAAALRLAIKDESSGAAVFRSPEDVQLRVPDSARTTVPGSGFGFLGAPGSTVYLLPQVQDPDLVWPGWSTERLRSGQVVGDAVRLRLAGVEGPGKVAVFSTDQFGSPSVIFDSAAPANPGLTVPIGTHAHASWAFGAPGVYRLAIEVSADLVGVGETAITGTYVVLVGSTTPAVSPDSVPPPRSGPSTEGGPPNTARPDNERRSGRIGEPDAVVAGSTASAPSRSGAATADGRLARTGGSSGVLVAVGSSVALFGLFLVLVAADVRRRTAVRAR